jgi:hypothetical protein
LDKRKLKSDSFSSSEDLQRRKRKCKRGDESDEDSSSEESDEEVVGVKVEDEEDDDYDENAEFEAIRTINDIKDVVRLNRVIDDDFVERIKRLMSGRYSDELDEEYVETILQKIDEYRNNKPDDEQMQLEEPVQIDLSCVKKEKS